MQIKRTNCKTLVRFVYQGGNVIEIHTVYENSKLYPYLLYNIYNRPRRLYVLGNLGNLNRKAITIVGARDCSNYGKKIAIELSYQNSKRGYVIVSGLAKGIDKYAHIGALKAKGRTIAVLAHGLNQIYPKENRKLAIEILNNNGTLITEYSFKDTVKKENFVNRNRIVSGLSEATIIVEAKEKSGSLITANFALEQGRNVYAVPGDISSNNSIGTNKLIQEGAQIISSIF